MENQLSRVFASLFESLIEFSIIVKKCISKTFLLKSSKHKHKNKLLSKNKLELFDKKQKKASQIKRQFYKKL